MKRPESRLAAGLLLFAVSAIMLINVAMVSCEETRLTARGTGREGAVLPGETRDGAIGDHDRPVSPTPTIPTGPADYHLSLISGEPEIRVRVLGSVDQVKFESASGLSIASSDPDGRAAGTVTKASGVVEVRLQSGVWVLRKAGGGEITRLSAAAAIVITGAGTAPELLINGNPYPGRVRLVARTEAGDKALDVIGHVGLEDYLPGVVAKEMPAGWPATAYQVQAVCARTYAMHERIRSAATKASFDVESNERDQAYAGATRNKPAIEAVRSTRGMVLADGDQLLRAYFSSTCGGRTSSARDTWPTGPGFEFNLAGPIQARSREFACQASPLFRWTVKRDRWELSQRIRTFGERNQLMVRKIKDLWAIEPATINPDNRPCVYKVIEPGGTWYSLSGEQLRLALNTSTSSMPAMGPPAPVETALAYGESETPAPVVSGGPADITKANRVASSDLEVTGPRGGNVVTIAGRGFGHGVGMCQYCVKAFADRGEDWHTLVLRFYPGARLVPAY